MFKFEIIESVQQNSRNRVIKAMKEKMTFSQRIEFSSKNKVNQTFIIAESQGKKILGGAYFLKKNLDEIQEDLRDLVTTLTSQNGHVWECSALYVDPSLQQSFFIMPNAEVCLQTFYRDLYAKFVELGLKNRAHFIIMKLATEDYDLSKNIGLWPYIVELNPHTAVDGLFHGILPLTGSQYEAYCRTWEMSDVKP